MRENSEQPPQEPDTRRRELVPPAIPSGHMDKKPQKTAGSFHRAARPLPSTSKPKEINVLISRLRVKPNRTLLNLT
jgi:hypothetical protein